MSASVFAVVAHPDDESLIAGGTLALARDAGARTGVVCLTRGGEGPISDSALATQETLADVREHELGAAAEVLGLSWSACLDLPDGELAWVDHVEAAQRLASLLGPHCPAAVLTFGEDGLYGHEDHVAARQIAGLAAELLEARGAGTVCIYEAAWSDAVVRGLVAAARERGVPSDLWGLDPEAFGMQDAEPSLVVDVTRVLPRKLAALRCHQTQLGGDHLLAALPDDLARQFLGEEPWRLARGADGALERLLGLGQA